MIPELLPVYTNQIGGFETPKRNDLSRIVFKTKRLVELHNKPVVFGNHHIIKFALALFEGPNKLLLWVSTHDIFSDGLVSPCIHTMTYIIIVNVVTSLASLSIYLYCAILCVDAI